MAFAVGSLVRARGREWVVLPESDDDLLMVRPLGGTDDEATGIYVPLESVEPAHFDLPDPSRPGDHHSCRLLRDAVRLGFRASAGPFRSFGRIGVDPRSYQLVPLLMALRQDPVRLLIADDVGIGKTIEAGLIAAELLARGEAQRLAVLCPPQLAEQWQAELREKFHLEAEAVLPSTAARLERHCRMGESLFERYPYVVVSLDFVKSDRRREEFARTCPELVIIDEAHTCAFGQDRRGGRHQRHELAKRLAADPDRHLLLVTATPHSGNESAFRSLLTLLSPDLASLPEDLSGPDNERERRRLAQCFVQRRRADVSRYLDEATPFPEREEREADYHLTPEYQQLFQRVLDYVRQSVTGAKAKTLQERVRWWSALALLRALASSPTAAAASLRSRAAGVDLESLDDVDELGRRTVLDAGEAEPSEGSDLTPGADPTRAEEVDSNLRDRLHDMARLADRLQGAPDAKLQLGVKLVKELLAEHYSPIVFCRFIATAHYLADQLRAKLSGVTVEAVTGELPPEEREARVAALSEADRRVLVCTDCLSEGINLQASFDAVLHYDLSWNPTRHEQREGRVDRYGQRSKMVRAVTLYGVDNQIDGIVLEVLLRKHKTIRSSLGISVPIPVGSEQLIEAVFEGLLLRERAGTITTQMELFEGFFRPQREQLHAEWESAGDRERRSQTMFAQRGIQPQEVAPEVEAMRRAIGGAADVAAFVRDSLRLYGASVREGDPMRIDLTETPAALRDAMGADGKLAARFQLPVGEKEVCLTRGHPLVEGLAGYVMDTALDPATDGKARRCGVIRTGAVRVMTTALLVRTRYHLLTTRGGREYPLLAEDCHLLAFAHQPHQAEWLARAQAEALLAAEPAGNVIPSLVQSTLERVLSGFDHLRPHLEEVVRTRGEELLAAHRRVRDAARLSGVRYRVEPQLPPDVLGLFVYLPAGGE